MTRLRFANFIAQTALLACVAAAPWQVASDYRGLEPGLEYKNEVRVDGPFSIHVLRIDRQKANWHWLAPLGELRIMGLSPVAKIVQETERWRKGRVVAAINGDWFAIKAGPYQGDPRGLQIVDGELVSAPAPDHAAFWVDREGRPHMGLIKPGFRVIWPDGKTQTPFGLNEHRPENQAVLYTSAMGHEGSEAKSARQSTKTVAGRELVLELENKGNFDFPPLQIGHTYRARITHVREAGDTKLGPNSLVLSLGPMLLKPVPEVKVGDLLTFRTHTSPELEGVRTALGGGFHLVQDGKEQPLPKADKVRHPRSMLGWNATHFFMVVVDGRQPNLSVGMTYFEMAALALRLGCSEAMALDGGGSATLWADKRLLNSPSDGQPRGVANALVLLEQPTNKSKPRAAWRNEAK